MTKAILQPFYILYVIIIFGLSLLAVLPFYFVISLPKNARSRRRIWQLTRLWARLWLRLTGMWVRVEGQVPLGNKFVVIANHISYIDPIVIYDVLPFYFRPLAKFEFSKIPLFGFVYAQIAFLVDRSSPAKRAKSMLQMQNALKHECSIFLYPEGTFNETSEPLKSFYDGAFRLAIEAQTDLLPIIFPDTNDRWNNSAWWKIWPGPNRAFVLPPVSAAGYSLAQLPELKELVKKTMAERIVLLNVR